MNPYHIFGWVLLFVPIVVVNIAPWVCPPEDSFDRRAARFLVIAADLGLCFILGMYLTHL